MGRRLYVGNLPYTTGEAELQELFSQAGNVESVRVMRDAATGRARGFAFVEMSTDEEAQKAATEFNQFQMGGRALTVNEARPKPEGGFGGRRRIRWKPRRRRRRRTSRAALVTHAKLGQRRSRGAADLRAGTLVEVQRASHRDRVRRARHARRLRPGSSRCRSTNEPAPAKAARKRAPRKVKAKKAEPVDDE